MSKRLINNDQASGLMQIAKDAKKHRVICVTGGKGGVGKSSISINLSVALSQLKKKVLLFDGDLGLSNIDVLLGLNPRRNLSSVLSGESSLRDIILTGPDDVKIIPATSGRELMANLSKPEYAGIITAFQEVSDLSDFLIIDTAAGISDGVTSFLNACDEIICVVCDEPTSITDTYALIKLMSREYGISKFHVLVNMSQTVTHGRKLYEKILMVTDRFLDVQLDLLGVIPFDDMLRKCICQQAVVLKKFPCAKSSVEFKRIAKRIVEREFSNKVNDKTTFFVDSILAES